MRAYFFISVLLFAAIVSHAQLPRIQPAANRTNVYVPMLQGKRVAVFANHTSTIGNTHLVDSLQELGVNIVKIFGPEHGFRGTADAGEKVANYTDKQTGIQVVSLYGSKKRPSASDLQNVDVILFDIQDVGVRFYTYISSLEEIMEAAFINRKPMMILDRPNPNGYYVDGPVLDTNFKSFVGMQPIPIVYGMTIGEYAMMIAGERWLSAKANTQYDYYRTAENSKDTAFHFQIIKCSNYTHKSKYVLPIKPSPNLPDMTSIYQYASTCFFEGTVLSEGRGTEHPFSIFGHPSYPTTQFAFTPTSTDGAKQPKFKDQLCYGWNIYIPPVQAMQSQIQLKYIIEAYKLFPNKDSFFLKPKNNLPTNYFFNKLAGNSSLMQQIQQGTSEQDIRASWLPQLLQFKQIRKKYLLYPDFE